MAGDAKRSMAQNADASKRRKGPPPKQRINIDAGDAGVFVTCDMGKEGKCKAEVLDIFSQIIEDSGIKPQGNVDGDGGEDSDDGDIEAQIQRELAGLQPTKDKTKKRPVEVTRLDMPCVLFARLDKSIDPVQLVHRMCTEAQANQDTKKSRWIKRMTPVTSVRKTLSVDLEAFIKEILKPHFHSGGGPKKFAIRPTLRGNKKFNRDEIIKTIADIVGPEHSVDLSNYDLAILFEVSQNVVGMSVVQGDYDRLKRYNLAEIYNPSPKGMETPKRTKTAAEDT
ncbi:hypothetical protein N7532_004641 [Penicillium argentinense]|uniref:THUMP domain-containing protein n=1 Tax=Penicillium argentinense TaxID=1131581 RepID=A0A9W9FPR1_9EURO|nr:uncharacterized protein N7532_004641 [Penicillium argentinense]KAJ5104112.1 hypothetical protein N7532_004641 [Penicillium argentinense]